MTGPEVKVEGLDLVLSNLRRVTQGLAREQESIHDHIGQSVLTRARSRARVRTGRMRSTLRLRSTSALFEVIADTPYAGYQHWGTRYVSPNLFLTEPLRELEDVLVDDYQRSIERYIDRVWRSNA